VLVFPLFEGIPFSVVLAAPSFAFWAWSYQLFGGRADIPKRTLMLLPSVALFSVAWFAVGWAYGLQYEGPLFTTAAAWISAGAGVVLAALVYLGLRRPSFATSLAVHWLLFAWILTYAFPYLGETP